jgi:tRNA threonylcarbamoyl adenosine modification protein (Sua5/YciO/YrdC/YwlC family)
MVIKIDRAQESLPQIIEILQKGGVVALPTDTVYGLAVDGTNRDAVERLFGVKQRQDKPFTFFIPRREIKKYAVVVKRRIIDFFVPGPLTVVMRKRAGVALPFIEDKVGVRIPQHDFVLRLLNAFGNPLAVTSANISGAPTLTSPYDIVEHFTQAELVVDGGVLYSQPSTVLDITTTPPMVMRKGVVSVLGIERVYGRKVMLKGSLKFNVLFVCSGNTCRSPMAEGIFRTLIERKYYEAKSAGTIAMGGLPAAHYAKQVVKEYGGSIRHHQTTSLDKEIVDWADLILVMEYKHYETALEISPDAVVKTFLLMEYKRKTKFNEVPDPVGKDLLAYRHAAIKMYPILKRVAKDIEGRLRRRQ